MKYGLIGFPLIHSFSKTLHEKLGNSEYELKQLNSDELEKFMREKKFLGLNVTIPYKKDVIKYIDFIDDNAKDIEAVNTIKNIDGVLYGYNTDALGFEALLYKNNIIVSEKTILILGTGATSRTVECVLKKLRSKKIYKRKRNGEYIDLNNDIVDYEDIKKSSVIINTTPSGMYPHVNDESLININDFDNLEALVDVIYNPLRTNFLQCDINRNIQVASGLYMLIAQGYFANKIFFDNGNIGCSAINDISFQNEDLKKIDDIYNDILMNKQNIVLIGMPSSGKTTIGKVLSEKTNKKFIDTDLEIEKQIDDNISNFINNFGEEKFRKIEKQVIENLSEMQGVIISTGGGSILDKQNVLNLKHNGKLYFINRSLENLKITNDRPLTNTFEKLRLKYDERLPIYKKVSDVEINGDLEIEEKVKLILNDFMNN